jgi:CHASE2 domain-containing sensor protein
VTLPGKRSVAFAERTALAALIVGLALLLSYSDWLWRWDRVFYDAQLRLWQRPPPDDIVIVAIDEATLRELGRWPWSRAVHAALLARLKNEQPKAVAFDIIFAEPDLQHPLDDAEFVAAVSNSGQVGLPVLMEQPRRDGQPIETMPFPKRPAIGKRRIPPCCGRAVMPCSSRLPGRPVTFGTFPTDRYWMAIFLPARFATSTY